MSNKTRAFDRAQSLVCMTPRPGLFFHWPDGYPHGAGSGWKRLEWLTVDDAWAKIIAYCGDDLYENMTVLRDWKPEGIAFGEIPPEKRDHLWPAGMAIVIVAESSRVVAVYRDDKPPEGAASPYCVIIIN